jgi:Protein of unknown function (DUF1566)
MKLNSRAVILVLALFLPFCSSAQEVGAGGLRDLGNGILEDRATRLQWTQRDNGRTIDGNDAIKYCANLPLAGGRWRLPSISELETICSSKFEQECIYEGRPKTCRVHSSFQLTGWALWSSTKSPYDPRDGRVFNFTLYLDCQKISMDASENPYIAPFGRAVCVRRSS